MRLSDLLGSQVIDSRGEKCGKVHDVRAVQDGAVVYPFGAALRIEGLVVGKGGLGERFGFHRSTVHGPWLLKAFFEWRHRDAVYAPWGAVAAIREGAIYLDRPRSELGGVAKL
jgi:hypothetical protein